MRKAIKSGFETISQQRVGFCQLCSKTSILCSWHCSKFMELMPELCSSLWMIFLVFKLCRLVLSEINAEHRVNTSVRRGGRHLWIPGSSLLSRTNGAWNQETWQRPNKQTNKQTSFIPLFVVKTELSSDKITPIL